MKTASITATIAGSGPERWVHADVAIRPGMPRFAIHGVCKDAAVEIRHMVKSAFDKAGKSMPSGTITADMDFAVPFEGIPELSITLAIAILLASEQIAFEQLSGVALKSGRESIAICSNAA